MSLLLSGLTGQKITPAQLLGEEAAERAAREAEAAAAAEKLSKLGLVEVK